MHNILVKCPAVELVAVSIVHYKALQNQRRPQQSVVDVAPVASEHDTQLLHEQVQRHQQHLNMHVCCIAFSALSKLQ